MDQSVVLGLCHVPYRSLTSRCCYDLIKLSVDITSLWSGPFQKNELRSLFSGWSAFSNAVILMFAPMYCEIVNPLKEISGREALGKGAWVAQRYWHTKMSQSVCDQG